MEAARKAHNYYVNKMTNYVNKLVKIITNYVNQLVQIITNSVLLTQVHS